VPRFTVEKLQPYGLSRSVNSALRAQKNLILPPRVCSGTLLDARSLPYPLLPL